jgi:hypothetical protein
MLTSSCHVYAPHTWHWQGNTWRAANGLLRTLLKLCFLPRWEPRALPPAHVLLGYLC